MCTTLTAAINVFSYSKKELVQVLFQDCYCPESQSWLPYSLCFQGLFAMGNRCILFIFMVKRGEQNPRLADWQISCCFVLWGVLLLQKYRLLSAVLLVQFPLGGLSPMEPRNKSSGENSLWEALQKYTSPKETASQKITQWVIFTGMVHRGKYFGIVWPFDRKKGKHLHSCQCFVSFEIINSEKNLQ